jgi:hypothetical protein
MFAHNEVDFVADSGWVNVDIPLDPIDANWFGLGHRLNKAGVEPYVGFSRYVAESAAIWAKIWAGNAYLCEVELNPLPGTLLPLTSDALQTKGRLLTRSLSFHQVS